MASLTLQVGALSASVQASDAVATEFLTDYAAAYELDDTGTAQERLQLVAEHLGEHIKNSADRHRVREDTKAARLATETALAEREWGA